MLEYCLIPTAGQLLWGLQLLVPISLIPVLCKGEGIYPGISDQGRLGFQGLTGSYAHPKELHLYVLNFETPPPPLV